MQHINLETFANGAFTAQVNRAIEEVTKNIQDPNTDAGTARKITVTIAFKPNQERNFIATGVQTKTTLAPALGAVTALSMGKDLRTGEVEAVEIGNQISGQMSVQDVPGVVPEVKMDFRNMPFEDNVFKVIVFDPPHLKQAGSESWLAKKYGVLPKDWKTYLKAGFDECMRVLEPDGILIFKWNEEQIKLNDVLKEFGKKPLLGDQRGKTRWIVFMK